METRICRKCNQEKSLNDEFWYFDFKFKKFSSWVCKKCILEDMRLKYLQKHPVSPIRTFNENEIIYKVCRVCGKKLSLNENFYNKGSYICKKCECEAKKKEWRKTHTVVDDIQRQFEIDGVVWFKCNKCGELKILGEENFSRNGKNTKSYKRTCKKCCSQYTINLNNKNKDKRRNYDKEYRLRPEVIKRKEELKIINKERDRKTQRDIARRYRLNPHYRLHQALSAGIRNSLKNNKNGNKWENLVGYTLIQLKEHLEKQFKEGMSWDNYGRTKTSWSLDHIRPVSSFNITDYYCDDFKKCWSFDNLQPMWHIDNVKKSNYYK